MGVCVCVCGMKVQLSPNKSWRLRRGMVCWASILTLTFSTTRIAELSPATPKEIPWCSFLLEIEWTPNSYCMWTDGLSGLKISEDPTRNETQDLASCGAVRQPIVPLLTPSCVWCYDCSFDYCMRVRAHVCSPETTYVLSDIYRYVIDGGMVVLLVEGLVPWSYLFLEFKSILYCLHLHLSMHWKLVSTQWIYVFGVLGVPVIVVLFTSALKYLIILTASSSEDCRTWRKSWLLKYLIE